MSKYYLEISADPGGDRKNDEQGRKFYCGFEAAILTQVWQKKKRKKISFFITQ